MLKTMRSVCLVAGFALALGCSSSGDDDDTQGSSAGSSNQAGTTGHAGSSSQTDGGHQNGNGGTSSSSGGSGKAGESSAGTSSNGGSSTGSGGSSTGNGGSSTGNGGSSTGNGGSSTGNGGSASSNGGTTSGNDPYGDARKRCVDRTNELRATKGKGPIPRLASAEPCADGQAKSDSESGKAHGAFNACLDQVKGWKGVAQNECPGYGSVEDTLTKCLDMMWAEGPGGGHYDNMMGDSTDTACGIYTTPAGKVWLVQDFWTK
jgi:hypothetical protein